MSFIGSIWAMDADAESLPSINLPTIYGDWEERSLPSLPDYEHLDIDDMDIDAATALVSDSQATVSQIRRARRRIPMLLEFLPLHLEHLSSSHHYHLACVLRVDGTAKSPETWVGSRVGITK